MQFVIYAKDAPGALEKRLATRAEHLAGVKRLRADGVIIDAGAILGDDGSMRGSVILCEFPDREALDAYVASEPYVRDGVWGDIEIIPLKRIDWATLMGD